MEKDCMLYAGFITLKGYGRIQVKIDNKWRTRFLHREIYLAERGYIHKDLVIDHICRNRSCININHMQEVTAQENFRRGVIARFGEERLTHCPKGHLFTKETTGRVRGNSRYCRICTRERNNLSYARKVGKV